jgi:hypothetical protein
MIGPNRTEGETRLPEQSPNSQDDLLPPWMRPRPAIEWRRAVGGIAVAAALAWAAVSLQASREAAVPRSPLAVALDFLRGGDFATLPADAAAPALAAPGIAMGALLVIAPLALVGRWVLGPVWRRFGPRPGPPKLGPDGQLPRWLRVVLFLLPPPPMRKPGGKPVMARFGFWIAALLHALPPPGPWWLRLLVPAVLGASSIRWWMLLAGAFVGIYINAIGAHLLANAGITPPAPPSGPMLIPLLLAPILITVLVRLLAQAFKRLRRK